MSKIPNFNKKEKALLKTAIEKFLEVNNLSKVQLTNKKIIEIINNAHDKWEIVTEIWQHQLRDSIRRKCGEHFETMEEKASREDKEQRDSIKENAKRMREDIEKKHKEEMEKEIAYWGVSEKDVEAKINPPEEVVSVVSRIEILKGTMDDEPTEDEVVVNAEVNDSGIVMEDEGISDFIGNISDPIIEEEIEIVAEPEPLGENVEIIAEPIPSEEIDKGVKEEIEEMVEEAKEKAIEEIQEVKEEVAEVVEEAKKGLEIDIDEILDNL